MHMQWRWRVVGMPSGLPLNREVGYKLLLTWMYQCSSVFGRILSENITTLWWVIHIISKLLLLGVKSLRKDWNYILRNYSNVSISSQEYIWSIPSYYVVEENNIKKIKWRYKENNFYPYLNAMEVTSRVITYHVWLSLN